MAKAVSHHARFSSELIIGGDKFAAQRQALNRPLDLVVGTPGRIVKHVEKGNMHMSGVTHLVLDEADTLFEAGFGDEFGDCCDRSRRIRRGNSAWWCRRPCRRR